MIGILSANVVLVLLAAGIASGLMPARTFSGALAILHNTVGITLPPPEKERAVAVIWIGSIIVIGDGTVLLLLLLTKAVFKG